MNPAYTVALVRGAIFFFFLVVPMLRVVTLLTFNFL